MVCQTQCGFGGPGAWAHIVVLDLSSDSGFSSKALNEIGLCRQSLRSRELGERIRSLSVCGRLECKQVGSVVGFSRWVRGGAKSCSSASLPSSRVVRSVPRNTVRGTVTSRGGGSRTAKYSHFSISKVPTRKKVRCRRCLLSCRSIFLGLPLSLSECLFRPSAVPAVHHLCV